MTVAVTAASGQLGRLVVRSLLDRGVPAGDIVAGARDPQKIADLAALGVRVREADYDRPETLAEAFTGVDRLLLVSGNEVGARVPQHTNAVHAAVAAGVSLIAYTSAPYADTTDLPIAPDHKATEEVIRATGVPYVFLRNGWYTENYTGNLAPALAHGAILGSAGDGKISAAARADFAAAAAAVLAGQGTEYAVYELGGDQPFTMAALAAEVSRQSGKQVVYRDLPPADYAQALVGAGLPEGHAQVLAGCDVSVKAGRLLVETGDLSRLIGRPTASVAASVAAGLARLP
jgi:NAD(P)H dehydrogenase (quinone)